MSGNHKAKVWAEAGLLFVLVFLAFGAGLSNGWIWDDDQYITENPALRQAGGLSSIWTDRQATPQYYPMVHSSYWLEYRIWGKETDALGREVPAPFGYHLDNTLLHALVALLFWRVLRRLGLAGAWFAAAMFAVHPVMTESVAWVTERKNLLSAFFMLAAAWAYLKGSGVGEKPGETTTESKDLPVSGPYLTLAIALFTAALFSKTVVAFLPGALLLIFWWRGDALRRHWVPLGVMLAIGIALGLHTAWLEATRVGAHGSEFDTNFVERSLIAARVPWFYLSKLVLPLNLHFIYPRWEVSAGDPLQWLFPVLTNGLLVFLWLWRKKLGLAPLIAVLIFGGALIPASGYFNVYPMQFSWVADHFQYHASMAFFALLAAWLASRTWFRKSSEAEAPIDGPLQAAWSPVAMGGGAALLAVLAFLSFRQCALYENADVLWSKTLERNPQAWVAHSNLARFAMEKQDLETAENHYRQLSEIKDDHLNSMVDYSLLLLSIGRLPQAKEQSERALELFPQTWEAQLAGARVALREKNPKLAKERASRALELSAENMVGRREEMEATLGLAYSDLGDYENALAHYENAIRLIQSLQRGTQLMPQILAKMGEALARSGETGQAIQRLRQALQMQSNNVPALVAMAWIQSAHQQASFRQGEQAVRFGEQAAMVTQRQDPKALDALASAYAESGRFPRAVNFAENAVRLFELAGMKEEAESAGKRLELYNRGRVFRSPTGFPENQ
ncbi:MAG: hypothetical protein DWQ01_15035 [Planctomycetota bacterium]|nr:MAG: hypothetical protein DWQ01_15035 [Planctomycetota bacterium]